MAARSRSAGSHCDEASCSHFRPRDAAGGKRRHRIVACACRPVQIATHKCQIATGRPPFAEPQRNTRDREGHSGPPYRLRAMTVLRGEREATGHDDAISTTKPVCEVSSCTRTLSPPLSLSLLFLLSPPPSATSSIRRSNHLVSRLSRCRRKPATPAQHLEGVPEWEYRPTSTYRRTAI